MYNVFNHFSHLLFLSPAFIFRQYEKRVVDTYHIKNTLAVTQTVQNSDLESTASMLCYTSSDKTTELLLLLISTPDELEI